jgi:hypothetical protein
LNVHSMKRNHARTIPSFNKWKQMNPGIPEVDMHEIRIPTQQHAPNYFEFASIHQSGSPRQIFQAPAPEWTDFRPLEQLKIWKGIEFRIFAKFGYDKALNPLQRGDLTKDVEHLHLEKIGAKTGNYRFHLLFDLLRICEIGLIGG